MDNAGHNPLPEEVTLDGLSASCYNSPSTMAHIIKKPVSIFDDLLGAVRTSRRLQVVICLVAALAILGVYAYCRYERYHQVEVRAEQEKHAQLERDAAAVQALFNFGSIGDSARAVACGIEALAGTDESLNRVVATQLHSRLAGLFSDTVFAQDVLLPSFYTEGHFQDTFQGDRTVLATSNFFDHVGTLLLIEPEVTFRDSAIGSGMKSSSFDIVCRAVHSLKSPMREVTVHLTGIGSTEESSLRSAFESLGEHKKEGSCPL